MRIGDCDLSAKAYLIRNIIAAHMQLGANLNVGVDDLDFALHILQTLHAEEQGGLQLVKCLSQLNSVLYGWESIDVYKVCNFFARHTHKTFPEGLWVWSRRTCETNKSGSPPLQVDDNHSVYSNLIDFEAVQQ